MLRVCTASLSSTVTALRMNERALYWNPHQIKINIHHIQKIRAVGFSSDSVFFAHATPPVLKNSVNQGVCSPDTTQHPKANLTRDLNRDIVKPNVQNISVGPYGDQNDIEYSPNVNKDGFGKIAVNVSNAEKSQAFLDYNPDDIINADASLNEKIESKVVQNVNFVAENGDEEIVVESVDAGVIESADAELTLDDPNIMWRDQTANRAYLYSTPAGRSLMFI